MKKSVIIIVLAFIQFSALATPYYPGIPSDYKVPENSAEAYGISIGRRMIYPFTFGYSSLIKINDSYMLFYYDVKNSKNYALVNATMIEFYLDFLERSGFFKFIMVLFSVPIILYLLNKKNFPPEKERIIIGLGKYIKNWNSGIKKWFTETKNLVLIPFESMLKRISDDPENFIKYLGKFFVSDPFNTAYKISYNYAIYPKEFLRHTIISLDNRYNCSGREGRIGEGDAIAYLDVLNASIVFTETLSTNFSIIGKPLEKNIKIIFKDPVKFILKKEYREKMLEKSAKELAKIFKYKTIKNAIKNHILSVLTLIKIKNSGYLDSFNFSISALNNSTSVDKSSTDLESDFTKSRKFSKSDDLANIIN